MKLLAVIYLVGFATMAIACVKEWADERIQTYHRVRKLNADSLERGEGRPYSVDFKWDELAQSVVVSLFWFAVGPFLAWASYLNKEI